MLLLDSLIGWPSKKYYIALSCIQLNCTFPAWTTHPCHTTPHHSFIPPNTPFIPHHTTVTPLCKTVIPQHIAVIPHHTTIIPHHTTVIPHHILPRALRDFGIFSKHGILGQSRPWTICLSIRGVCKYQSWESQFNTPFFPLGKPVFWLIFGKILN